MSPLFGGRPAAGDDEIAVEDAGLDHRVAADPQHEQLAVAGEVGGEGQELLDVLLGEDVGAGGDVADQRDVAHRSALVGGARCWVVPHLDGTRLGGVSSQVAEPLERVQVAVDRRRRGETDGVADLPDRGG